MTLNYDYLMLAVSECEAEGKLSMTLSYDYLMLAKSSKLYN